MLRMTETQHELLRMTETQHELMRIGVMAAQQTLTLLVEVRVLYP